MVRVRTRSTAQCIAALRPLKPSGMSASSNQSAGRTSRSKRYLASLGSSWGFRILGPAMGFVLTPFVLLHLGAERFGSYVLIGSFIAWLGLVDPGIAAGLRVALARTTASSEQGSRAALFSAAARAQLALGMLTCCAAVALALAIGVDAETRTLALLLGVGSGIVIASSAATSALASAQLIYLEQLVRASRTFTRAALTLLFFSIAGGSLIALGWANIAAAVFSSLLAIWLCANRLPSLSLAARPHWSSLRALVPTGVWLSIGSLAGLAITHSDRIVVGKLVGLEALTTYAVTASLFLLAENLIAPIVDSARPALAESLGAGAVSAARRIYHQVSRAVAGLGVVAAGCVLSANQTFVAAWTGTETYAGFSVDLWFAATLVLQVWILSHRALLTAQLDVRVCTQTRGLEAALNLVLSLALASFYGLAGVAAATALAAASTSAWRLPHRAAKHLQAPPMQGLGPALQTGCALIPVVWLARLTAHSIGGFSGALTAVAMTGSWGGLLLWNTAGEDLRWRIRSWRPNAA